MIHHADAADVFGEIDGVLDSLRPAAEYRDMFDKAVTGIRVAAESSPVFLPSDLPLAVADLMGISREYGLVAAAASTLLWAGADLMDDAADGELPAAWQGVSPSRLALVTTNLLVTLPQLLVSQRCPEAAGPYSHAIARTLFAMSEGQWADLDSSRTVTTTEQYLALVRRKSGAEFALFCSTPALLSEADAELVAAWVGFGFAYGTMIQVFSDTFSSVAEGPRNDLLKGKRTLPVLFALRSLRDAEHTAFVKDLDLAALGDHTALRRSIATFTEAGAIRASIESGERLRYRASKALPVALASVGAAHPIRGLLQAYSLI